MHTFFDKRTAKQYVCTVFKESQEDYQKYDIIFTNRIKYSAAVHEEVRVWVENNISRWQAGAGRDWFKIDKIPNDFLPAEVL